MNIENEFLKILKIRNKMDIDFERSKNIDDLEDYLDENVENVDELYKIRFSNTEDGIREYYLNKFLRNQILAYRDTLIKYPGSFSEFKQIIENSSKLKYGEIKLSPLFKTINQNELGFKINTNVLDQLSYNEIDKRINHVPNNLVGIVNARIGYNGNKEYYYGSPIIYEKKEE